MATLVLHPDPQSFPIGTTVKVRERVEPHAPYLGEPPGSILSEPVVAAGPGGGQSTLTVTTTAGKRYVGYALVGGVDRYVAFEEPAAAAGAGSVSSVNGKEGAVTLAAVDVGADAEGEAALKLAKSTNLSDLANKATARTNLELGTAAQSATTAFDAAGAATTAQGASTPKQKAHATVTTDATTATVNQVTPVDATSGALAIKLPTAQVEGSIISIIKIDSSANEVTIEGSIEGSAATVVLRLQNDGRSFLCRADGSWVRLASYLSIVSLDGRYCATGDSRLSNERTPSAASVTAAKMGAEAIETAAVKEEAVTKKKLAAAVQEELEPKVVEKSWVIPGEPKAETYPGFEIKLGAHEARNLIGMSVKLLAGTSCVVKILKGGTLITAYEATAKSTESVRVSSSKALANEDEITLKVESLTGKPEGLRVTLFLEAVK